MTLSMTFFQGKSASVWNTKPTRGSMPVTGPPISRTSPALGGRDPYKIERRRFAASGGADDGDELAAGDRHVEIAQGRQGLAGRRDEAAADVDQLDRRDLVLVMLHDDT